MKNKRIASTLSFLFMGLFLASNVFAADMKFAYVDIAKVFDEYQKTKDNDAVLQELGKKKEEERDRLVDNVRQLKDEMLLLSEDAQAEKQADLEKLVRQLQEFDLQTKQELGQKRQEVVREIFKDIDDLIQKHGETKGYDLIINQRALLYQKMNYDISQDILGELNKSYKKK